ncbi:hypothetical protein ACFC0D_02355 [Streptomyces sp. NPDC056222]|uniref:hypothetical protein n=1 Tax=Streptomyces sp. NPDC056222 TaxID=3345749 RepID=UPI0035E22FDC
MTQQISVELPRYHNDEATRLLCGYTYLSTEFAGSVIQDLVAERLRAHGLPLGVDLVALVRHARVARRLHAIRDGLLTVCWLVLCFALVAAVVALTEPLAVRGERLGDCLQLAGCGLLSAVVVVFAAGLVCRRAARRIHRGEVSPREGAAAVASRVEEELDGPDETNVVPYGTSGKEELPFVGSGVRISETVWPGIEVGRPAKDDQGAALPMTPFDAVELHACLIERLADVSGIEELRARNRLYVQGHQAHDLGAELLPDPLRRPRTRIDPGLVEAGITEKERVMRTYLALDVVGAGGAYVVTMFVRARLSRSLLSWEVSAYVLPPLHALFDQVANLPRGRVEEVWRLIGITLSQLWKLLSRAPVRLLRRVKQRVRNAWRLWWDRQRILHRKGHFDYGTVGSVRSWAADLERLDYLQRMDVLDTFQRLEQGVLLTTEQFLREHNVDTSDFERAQTLITHHSYTFKGAVVGQNVFGNYGSNIASGPVSGTANGIGPAAGVGVGPMPTPAPRPGGTTPSRGRQGDAWVRTTSTDRSADRTSSATTDAIRSSSGAPRPPTRSGWPPSSWPCCVPRGWGGRMPPCCSTGSWRGPQRRAGPWTRAGPAPGWARSGTEPPRGAGRSAW